LLGSTANVDAAEDAMGDEKKYGEGVVILVKDAPIARDNGVFVMTAPFPPQDDGDDYWQWARLGAKGQTLQGAGNVRGRRASWLDKHATVLFPSVEAWVKAGKQRGEVLKAEPPVRKATVASPVPTEETMPPAAVEAGPFCEWEQCRAPLAGPARPGCGSPYLHGSGPGSLATWKDVPAPAPTPTRSLNTQITDRLRNLLSIRVGLRIGRCLVYTDGTYLVSFPRSLMEHADRFLDMAKQAGWTAEGAPEPHGEVWWVVTGKIFEPTSKVGAKPHEGRS
jgi:hypothetical protein